MSEPAPVAKRSRAARFGRLVLLAIGPCALALAGAAYVIANARYITTENAYIKADKIAVSTEVSGHVVEVAVRENDIVAGGQLLFRLDDTRFELILAQRHAALQAARQEVEALRALYRQKTAELQSVEAEIAYYDGEFERAERLQQQGHMANAQFEETRRDRMMAVHHLEAVRQETQAVLASLGGDAALPVDDHPMVLAASNAMKEAALDLSRTIVSAPVRSVVSNIDLQVGEYIELGEPVFSLVDAEHLWIEANLKETELTHVREAQTAEITLDAYPDFEWQGKVIGIAPATGAEFSLLPPQNASGNWVKVVQRIPVRLDIKRQLTEPPLRAGMSVRVRIDTGHEMALPGVVRQALAWVQDSGGK